MGLATDIFTNFVTYTQCPVYNKYIYFRNPMNVMQFRFFFCNISIKQYSSDYNMLSVAFSII